MYTLQKPESELAKEVQTKLKSKVTAGLHLLCACFTTAIARIPNTECRSSIVPCRN